MKSFFLIAFSIVGLLILLKVFVLWIEPKLTFYPFRQIEETPEDYGVPYQEYFIDSTNAVRLWAWYLEHSKPRAEVAFFHGNAGNLSKGRLELLIDLYRHGFSVFVFDYRGYGKSTGKPSEAGVLADSKAAVDFFWTKLHREESKVIYHGRSLGGFTAAFAAKLREPDGLILECTFPDQKTLVRHFPLLMRLLALFSRYELTTVDYLDGVDCPILVIHGDRDEIVPFQVGENLYSRIRSVNKKFIRIPGGGHEDLYTFGAADYWSGIDQFLQGLKKQQK
jgi:hypothetical protein